MRKRLDDLLKDVYREELDRYRAPEFPAPALEASKRRRRAVRGMRLFYAAAAAVILSSGVAMAAGAGRPGPLASLIEEVWRKHEPDKFIESEMKNIPKAYFDAFPDSRQ